MPELTHIQTSSTPPVSQSNIEDCTNQLCSKLFGSSFVSSSSILNPTTTSDIVKLYSGPEDIHHSKMDSLEMHSMAPVDREECDETVPIFQIKPKPKKTDSFSIYSSLPPSIKITTDPKGYKPIAQSNGLHSIIQSDSPLPLTVTQKKVFDTTKIGNIAIAIDPANDPKPHSREHVRNAKPDDYVNVMRIISPTQPRSMSTDVISGLHVSFNKMYNHSSDENTTAPSKINVQGYVNQNRDVAGDLIEFTTNPTKVRKFASEGTRHYDVTVSIQRKFLTESESSEEGWMAKQNAPYTITAMHGYDTSSIDTSAKRMSAEEAEQACNAEKQALLIFEEQQIGKSGFLAKYGRKAMLQNMLVQEGYKGDKANQTRVQILTQQISKL